MNDFYSENYIDAQTLRARIKTHTESLNAIRLRIAENMMSPEAVVGLKRRLRELEGLIRKDTHLLQCDSEYLLRESLLKLNFYKQIIATKDFLTRGCNGLIFINRYYFNDNKWLLNRIKSEVIKSLKGQQYHELEIGYSSLISRSENPIICGLCSKLKLNPDSSATEMSGRLYEKLKSQNVIITFHFPGSFSSEQILSEIKEVCKPIASNILTRKLNYKIYFILSTDIELVDSENYLQTELVTSRLFQNFILPEIEPISFEDFRRWREVEVSNIPIELQNLSEEMVLTMINKYDSIPELLIDWIYINFTTTPDEITT